MGVEESRKGRWENVSREATSVRTYVRMYLCNGPLLVGKEARLATHPKEACNGGHMVDTSAFH